MKRIFVILTFLFLLMGCTVCSADDSVSGDYRYTVLSDDSVMITKYTGSAKDLSIPDTLADRKVTRIGKNSFQSCNSLTSVVIPDSVVFLDHQAFFYCQKLSSVTIPDSVVEVGGNPFMSCEKLRHFELSDSHPYLEVVDGVLFGKTDKKLISYPFGASAHEYTIPEGTRIIVDRAFYQCSSLKAITIPDSVTDIGMEAFMQCTSLKSIALPDHVSYIGANPFAYCSSLKTITVSENHPYLSLVDGVLFSKPDKRLVSYPNHSRAKEYDIPSGTKIVGNWAFSACSHLKSVSIPDGVTELGDGAFFNCTGLKKIDIPEGVTSIGVRCFYMKDGSATITIPDSVSYIAEDAFAIHYGKQYRPNLNLTLIVGKNTYAEKFCESAGLKYQYRD